MTDLKITVDQIKNYLGACLRCECVHKTISKVELKNKMFTLNGIDDSNKNWPFFTNDQKFVNQFGCVGKYFRAKDFKPIVYRLSDLDKHIPELGFVPLAEIDIYSKNKEYLIECATIGMVEKIVWDMLVKWHFWPFGEDYFNKGLVIDKLKLNK